MASAIINKALPTTTTRSGTFEKETVRPKASVTLMLVSAGASVAGAAVALVLLSARAAVAGAAVGLVCAVQADKNSATNKTMDRTLFLIIFSFRI